MKTRYVLGFLFDDKKELVALIEKQKPEWQKGHLNGIGGKIEDTDASEEFAMAREFQEETGVQTDSSKWRKFATMTSDDWIVTCYTQSDSDALDRVITTTCEQVSIIHVTAVRHHKTISNVPWLISMALDENMGNKPFYADVRY